MSDHVFSPCGPDKISTYILRECAEEIAPILTNIFTTSLTTGTTPSLWRTANIVAIFKKGSKMSTELQARFTHLCCMQNTRAYHPSPAASVCTKSALIHLACNDSIVSLYPYFYVRTKSLCLWPCSHCHSCAGTVPICRISRVCERAMSAIKLDLISEN